jgi:hypothetical protein
MRHLRFMIARSTVVCLLAAAGPALGGAYALNRVSEVGGVFTFQSSDAAFDQCVGTGLEDIHNAIGRLTFPVIVGIHYRF